MVFTLFGVLELRFLGSLDQMLAFVYIVYPMIGFCY